MLVQALDQLFGKREHTTGQQIHRSSQRHRRKNIQDRVGIEERGLIAKNRVFGQSIHVDGGLCPMQITEMRLKGAFGDARGTRGIQDGHGIVYTGPAAKSKELFLIHRMQDCFLISNARKPTGLGRLFSLFIRQDHGRGQQLQQQPQTFSRHGDIQWRIGAARVQHSI